MSRQHWITTTTMDVKFDTIHVQHMMIAITLIPWLVLLLVFLLGSVSFVHIEITIKNIVRYHIYTHTHLVLCYHFWSMYLWDSTHLSTLIHVNLIGFILTANLSHYNELLCTHVMYKCSHTDNQFYNWDIFSMHYGKCRIQHLLNLIQLGD